MATSPIPSLGRPGGPGRAERHGAGLASRGLEGETLDPYLAGWRKRVVSTRGHIPVRMVTNGVVDRAVHAWIADECGRSTVKTGLTILVRVMKQAVRDGIIDRNPAGEVSGARAADIDRDAWTWTVRRQTTPSPGSLIDKGTKGKWARAVPLIEEVRETVAHRIDPYTCSARSPDTRPDHGRPRDAPAQVARSEFADADVAPATPSRVAPSAFSEHRVVVVYLKSDVSARAEQP